MDCWPRGIWAEMNIDQPSLEQAYQAARRQLLGQITSQGHWAGELSSSALATATAAFALARAGGSGDAAFVAAALRWLVAHANPDGGWGDTPDSPSNLSTSLLAWSALSIPQKIDGKDEAVEAVESYVFRQTASLQPRELAQAVTQSYGEDSTFSAPILSMCALAGRLGPIPEAFDLVPPLPFELAALPHSWLRFLRIPVVSYALPALVAIGQLRHVYRPPRCSLTRGVRRWAAKPSLRKLQAMLPASGGYLEAAPLTSFVVMSLVAIGQGDHPVVHAGCEFLRRGMRADGSWPIDTNLAMWVTTSAINAMVGEEVLSQPQRQGLADWLLAQQLRREHPFTHAAPGGWAWTDLSGGVSDADDTAGALAALDNLQMPGRRVTAAASAGVRWLVNLQNADGGVPTFCRGWGTLPFDRSSSDLTAHALRAWVVWLAKLPRNQRRRTRRATHRAIDYLQAQQAGNGSWTPLWFGNQRQARMQNPVYGTARVAIALTEIEDATAKSLLPRAAAYLLQCQNSDGGWGGDAGVESSIEESALAVEALVRAALRRVPEAGSPAATSAVQRAVEWLLDRTQCGTQFPAEPIGLYFARLWYAEKLYPLIFTVSALGQVRRLCRMNGAGSPH